MSESPDSESSSVTSEVSSDGSKNNLTEVKVTWNDQSLMKKNLSKFGIINSTFDENDKSIAGSFIFRSSSTESLSSKVPRRDQEQIRSASVAFPRQEIRITWSNLTYDVSKYVWTYDDDSWLPSRSYVEKQILKKQSGEIKGGTLTGLMGPSGAGKSTLLNCITGRYNEGVGGEVLVTYPSDRKSINISFVPQKDHLFPQFTVRETLVLASKLKNPSSTDHDVEAQQVINSLNLESCSNVKVSKCSGGQVKRISIGVELISHPDVLVLDEPTSGLDSSNAESCIRLLRDLTIGEGPAIVCTIHQPNYEIFNYFHQVYILSSQGQNIYSGTPCAILPYFEQFKIRKPEYVNPADYAMDVASGKFFSNPQEQDDTFQIMATHQLKKCQGDHFVSLGILSTNNNNLTKDKRKTSTITSFTHVSNSSELTRTAKIGKLLNKTKNENVSNLYHLRLLFWRSLQVSCFRSKQLAAKCLMNLIISLLVSFMFKDPPGVEDGCWSGGRDFSFANMSESDELRELAFNNAGSNAKDAKAEYIAKVSRITDNTNFLFAICTYILMTYSIGTVLVIPLELATAMKEIGNSWYKTWTYFLAKTLSDMIPLVISIGLDIVIVYNVTQQMPEWWRFGISALTIILLSWVCESVGMLIGIVLSSDLTAATLVTMAAAFPTLIYSGYLVRIAAIPWFFQPLTYLSYVRFAFEASLVSTYGWGRCSGGKATADFIDNLVAANNPVDLISTLWESFNITSSDAHRFAALIGAENQCMESVVNGTGQYLGYNLDGSPVEPLFPDEVNVTEITTPEEPFQSSYVLSYFKLQDDDLYSCLIALFNMVVVIRFLTYVALHLKTRIRN